MATPRRVLALLVVVLLGDAFLLWGDRARVVTPSRAVASFRASGTGNPGPPLPRAGVYLYDTTGFERVNRLSIRRAYPAVSVRVVKPRGGCAWTEEVALFREHTETYDVCADGSDVRDTGFGTRLSYYFVDAVTSLSCGTGGTRTGALLAPGGSTSYACSGGAVRAEVTVRYEGPGTAAVEGEDVPCRRVAVVTVLTGDVLGTASRELCTDERTGLVLTEERAVGLRVTSRFVGRVTYLERATFRLRSLVPLT